MCVATIFITGFHHVKYDFPNCNTTTLAYKMPCFTVIPSFSQSCFVFVLFTSADNVYFHRHFGRVFNCYIQYSASIHLCYCIKVKYNSPPCSNEISVCVVPHHFLTYIALFYRLVCRSEEANKRTRSKIACHAPDLQRCRVILHLKQNQYN
jgi:hypothetical protein